MTNSQPHRQPPGIPSGGQFAPKHADAADIELALGADSGGGDGPVEDADGYVDESDGEGEADYFLFSFEGPDGRELEVDYRGDGEYAVYSEQKLLAEFTSLSDPSDQWDVEDAVLAELEQRGEIQRKD